MTMNRSQLYDYTCNEIQAYDVHVDPTDHVYRLLDLGQQYLVGLTGCYQGTGTITTVDGTTEYALASDILACKRALRRVRYSTTAELYPVGLEEARIHSDTLTASTEGTPTHYYLWWNGATPTIGFLPTPDTSDVTITYWYVKVPTSLTSPSGAVVIPSGWEHLISDWAVIRCLNHDKKFETADRLEARFKHGVKEFEVAMRNFDASDRPRMRPATPQAVDKHLSIASK